MKPWKPERKPDLRKSIKIALEVICLLILTPVIYWYAVFLLIFPADIYVSSGLPSWLAIAIILVLDVVWTVSMILSKLMNIHLKVILTLLVYILSTAGITGLFVAPALRDAFM